MNHFGPEYPAAILVDGRRIPLTRESRFWRSYADEEQNIQHEIPRFMDGSAAMTLTQLQSEWPAWSKGERLSFCYSSAWLGEQADFPDMLRFIMEHGSPDDWAGIALSVAIKLPGDEAFDRLVRALHTANVGGTGNISQAIAHTRHPQTQSILREHLNKIWSHEGLWADNDFTNWPAFDAITCIAHLIESGAPSADFEEQVRQLSKHVCSGSRDSCKNFLAKYYPWLN